MADVSKRRRLAANVLEAAYVLNDCPDGEHVNSVMNRAYYAIYHAVVACLEESGEPPPNPDPDEGQNEWPHKTVKSKAQRAAKRKTASLATAVEVQIAYDTAFSLRVEADYKPGSDPASVRGAQQVIDDVKRCILLLGVQTT